MSPVALGKMLGYLQHQLTDLHLEKLLGPEASIDLSDPQGALRQWVFVKIELLESFCMSILQSPFNNVSQFTHQVLLLLCASKNLMNHSCFLSHVLNKRQIWNLWWESTARKLPLHDWCPLSKLQLRIPFKHYVIASGMMDSMRTEIGENRGNKQKTELCRTYCAHQAKKYVNF